MTSPKRRIAAALLLALLAATAWFLSEEEAGGEQPQSLRAERDQPQSEQPTLPASPPPQDAESLTLPEAASGATVELPPRAALDNKVAARATVILEVFDGATEASVPGARLQLAARACRDPVDADSLEAHTLTVDGSGRVSVEVPHTDLEIVARTDFNQLGYLTQACEEWSDGDVLRIELLPLTTVKGMVRSQSGHALPGVRVSSAWWQGSDFAAVHTNESGRFEFPLWVMERGGMLEFEKLGFGLQRSLLIVESQKGWAQLDDLHNIEWRSTAPFLDVTMLAEKRVRGVVRSADGEPVADTDVIALGRVGAGMGVFLRDDGSALTDAEGHFELTGLRLDALHLILCESGGGSVAAWASPAQADLDLGELHLEQDRRVSGRVVDHLGVPLADIQIELRVTDEGAPYAAPGDKAALALIPVRELEILTAADGRFELRAPPRGSAKLWVRHEQGIIERRELDLGEPSLDVGELRVEVKAELSAEG